jgi:hypothetical protein
MCNYIFDCGMDHVNDLIEIKDIKSGHVNMFQIKLNECPKFKAIRAVNTWNDNL